MINIALGFDKGYCRHAGATIQSIVYNTKTPVKFYLMIDNSVTRLDRYFLKSIIEKNNHQVEFVDMSEYFNDLYTGNWSKAMYYPIVLANIIKDSDRVLFLDSDIIVTNDLTDFYNIDLNNYYVAAVHDCAMRSVIKMKRKMRMSISKEKITMEEYFSNMRKWNDDDISKYFNSGMLLLNLEFIKQQNAIDRMFEILKTENLACPDQDCFNICFHDNVKIMPVNYNFKILDEGLHDNMDVEAKKIYDEYLVNDDKIPDIIHFLIKPWRQKNVLLEKHYFKYLKQLPFFYKLTNPNFNKKIFCKNIFSINNYYHQDKKDKILTILGLKFRIKTEKLNEE